MGIEYGEKRSPFIDYGRPSLFLDFAKRKSLVDAISRNNLITFTRSSTGTYVGSDGLIKTAAADEPRFDHNPETGESLGLLIEESRTNYVAYSENFNTWWTITVIGSVTANSTTSPDGNNNGTLLVNKQSTAFTVDGQTIYYGGQIFRSAFAYTGAGSHTWSLFAKAKGCDIISIIANTQGGGAKQAYFDLSNGTVFFAPSETTCVIEPYPNGWYKCSVTWNQGSSVPYAYNIQVYSNTEITGSDGIYIWGAQLEKSSFPTSYIPTSGSTITRQPDSAIITGTNFTDFYNQTEGSIFWNGIPNQSNNGCQAYHFDDGTSNNRHFMRPDSGNPQISYTSSGTNRVLSVPAFGEKIAYAYKSNNYGASQDGLLYPITSLSSVPSGLIQLGIGYRADNNDSHINGHIKQLLYYPTRLTNTQLQALTQ